MEADVLLEKPTRGRAIQGFTENYIRVELSRADSPEELDNQIVKVVLDDFNLNGTALRATLSNP